MKLDTFPKFFITLILIVFLSVLAFSCYGPNKAGKQVSKALREYPDTAAALIRDEFPCVDGKPDSIAFKASVDSLRKLLSSSSNQVMSYFNRLQYLTDSIKAAQKASGDDCPTLLAQSTDYIAQSNIQRDSLLLALDSEKEIRRQILRWVDNIKPVIQPVEDSAKIRLAIKGRDEAVEELLYWQEMFYKDHEWRVAMEKKIASHYVLYIPWWILATIGGLMALIIFLNYTKLLKFPFNPFSLFKKNKS